MTSVAHLTTQWQQDGYVQIVTLKQIVVTGHLARLILLKQRRELKLANLGWLKTSLRVSPSRLQLHRGDEVVIHLGCDNHL